MSTPNRKHKRVAHHLKKYPNRRLYDTTASLYVTVDDVRKLIVKGQSIKVEDSKDGSDVTRTVLLQILSEQESKGHEPILTNRSIEQIMRFYGDQFGKGVSRYIESSILTFLEHQDQYRKRLKQLSDLSPLNLGELNPMNIMRQVLNPQSSADNKK